MTLKPETAKDFAESPSVKINVQSKECLPPKKGDRKQRDKEMKLKLPSIITTCEIVCSFLTLIKTLIN